MKTSTQRTLVGLVVIVIIGLVIYKVYPQKIVDNVYAPTPEHIAENEGHEYVTTTQLAEYATSDLSEQEIADIYHMRQEEKLARDVYRALSESYAINQFLNIPESEQKHTDAMELLIERYDLEDPISDESLAGIYGDAKFTNLYQQLTTEGSPSLKAALTVGAKIEDMNMNKLLEVIENTDNEDIAYVYRSVLSQSHHHMQAFYRALQAEGGDYTPAYVSQEYFDQVIADGGQGGSGEGRGAGNHGGGQGGQQGRNAQ